MRDEMKRFEFMIGEWDLIYNIPESEMSPAAKGSGHGIMKRILDGRYVSFDYEASINNIRGKAHGIFAWDEKWEVYRYWWFENSGNYMSAVCDFVDEHRLRMHWDNTMLIQHFVKQSDDKMLLEMGYSGKEGKLEPILEVLMIRT
jgi:hypothetical protein